MDHVDVIVVGAGITGIDMASSLLGKGKDVLLMDRSMDLGFPPSGPCFISFETYHKYLLDYESYVNAIFSSVTILGDHYEEEIKLSSENRIVSIDREKLVRSMAYNFSMKGGKLKIASTIDWVRNSGTENTVGWMREGKHEEVSCDIVIFNTGKIDGKFLHHQKVCKQNQTEAHYVRYIPERKSQYFTVEFGDDHMNVSSSNGILGEDLNILSQPRSQGAISSTSYHVERHTCFPHASPGIYPGGNIMGSRSYLGRGLNFSLSYNRKLVSMINGNWQETVQDMERVFQEMDEKGKAHDRDLLDTILYRIPIFS